jgi:hypothetical protein
MWEQAFGGEICVDQYLNAQPPAKQTAVCYVVLPYCIAYMLYSNPAKMSVFPHCHTLQQSEFTLSIKHNIMNASQPANTPHGSQSLSERNTLRATDWSSLDFL